MLLYFAMSSSCFLLSLKMIFFPLYARVYSVIMYSGEWIFRIIFAQSLLNIFFLLFISAVAEVAEVAAAAAQFNRLMQFYT